jgi:hypothetical protein
MKALYMYRWQLNVGTLRQTEQLVRCRMTTQTIDFNFQVEHVYKKTRTTTTYKFASKACTLCKTTLSLIMELLIGECLN